MAATPTPQAESTPRPPYVRTTRNRAFVLNRAEELRAKLGEPNEYGEYCGFVCPRCHGRYTHATPALELWRCWDCGWGGVDELIARDNHVGANVRAGANFSGNGTGRERGPRVFQVPT